MKKVILITLAALISVTACSSNYELGDMSRVYCGSTSPEFRAQIKATMTANGIVIGLDYCATVGLIDQMIVKKPKE
jgi:hypothetical protein